MGKEISGQSIRKVLLDVINELGKNAQGNFQSNSVLREASRRLSLCGLEYEQALLTYWYDLFRTGHLSWGYNLSNPEAPFCHLTDQGRRTLENLSRDPANPDGYLAHIYKLGALNSIAESYIKEALKTYNSDCFKAAAVMVGVAAESLILELRDEFINKMNSFEKSPLKDLEDWRIKRVLDAFKAELDNHKSDMPKQLFEATESYWPAFTYQVRTTRNEAGHPNNIETVTSEAVHASLLIFPELVKLAGELKSWISTGYK